MATEPVRSDLEDAYAESARWVALLPHVLLLANAIHDLVEAPDTPLLWLAVGVFTLSSTVLALEWFIRTVATRIALASTSLAGASVLVLLARAARTIERSAPFLFFAVVLLVVVVLIAVSLWCRRRAR